MPENGSALATGLRTATGVLGTLVGAAAIVVASVVPLPDVSATPQPVTVMPEPVAQQLVCPGAALRLGDESGENATSARVVPGQRVTALGGSGVTTTSVPLAGVEGSNAASAPLVVSVPASEEVVPVSAAQSQVLDGAELAGLAAAACTRPSSDTWLVGGSTAVGRTTLLTLANPGSALSTVSVAIAGPDGPVTASGATGIVVPALSQRVVSLAGFAPGVEELVVHVTSQGGPVAAALQQSTVRGIDAGGVDVIGPAAAPSRQVVIPGIVIGGAADAGALLGQEGYADLAPSLRLYVPGDAPTEARLHIVPEVAGEDAQDSRFTVTLDAGRVTDVPVGDLGDGSYTVTVEADVPVVAGFRVSAVAGGTVDLAWAASADALTDSAFLAVAPGPEPALRLANPGTAAVEAVLEGTDGTRTVTVPAQGSTTVAVSGGHAYTLTGAVGLHAAVVYLDGARVATYTVATTAGAEQPVVVHLG